MLTLTLLFSFTKKAQCKSPKKQLKPMTTDNIERNKRLLSMTRQIIALIFSLSNVKTMEAQS